MKRCTTSLIREMQIKSTTRYHLTTVKMAIIKKTKDKCWWGCGDNNLRVHGWMDKVYKYKRLLCNHNKEGNPFICDNMDGPWGIILFFCGGGEISITLFFFKLYNVLLVLPNIILSEVSQTEKDKYCVTSLICGNWKKQFIETWQIGSQQRRGN